VTVAWADAPCCDVSISEEEFTLGAGESRTLVLLLDPATVPASEPRLDLALDVSAREAAGAGTRIRVAVDIEPYGAARIACGGGGPSGRGAAAWAFLLLAAAALLLSRRRPAAA
jgi:hypothetical protein